MMMVLMMVQIAGAAAIPSSPLGLIIGSTLTTKIVLAFLVLLSLISWTIMLIKWREFANVNKVSRDFLLKFENADRFDQATALASRSVSSPYTRVLARAAQFAGAGRRVSNPGVPSAVAPLSAAQVEAMRLLLDAETNIERDRLARRLPWLATIGSVSPLIGLLGTVLGVIDAFVGIATKGSGNIGAVAPGVAEALIATAAALSVAIPAVFGYNLFASRLNRFDDELDGFGSTVIALVVRAGGS
jgi:biopolymer transport protein TolQ